MSEIDVRVGDVYQWVGGGDGPILTVTGEADGYGCVPCKSNYPLHPEWGDGDYQIEPLADKTLYRLISRAEAVGAPKGIPGHVCPGPCGHEECRAAKDSPKGTGEAVFLAIAEENWDPDEHADERWESLKLCARDAYLAGNAAGREQGYEAGQKAMRERAAQVAHVRRIALLEDAADMSNDGDRAASEHFKELACEDAHVRDAIRALPIARSSKEGT